MTETATPSSLRSLRNPLLLAGVIAVLWVAWVASVEAHHANSAYDRERTVSVAGTVRRWQFINPHSGIWIDVVEENGKTVEWAGEFQSVQDLYRQFRWNKDTFRPGDEVTLIGNPDRREGSASMWVSAVIFADGTRVDVRDTP